ncbi:heavy metal translocating P-type ATPase [Candidatus Woesearchaeota archaeon]|nr:heavy metal translocating P-type ATPase [Candidatus Woesearchaeota archaeon]
MGKTEQITLKVEGMMSTHCSNIVESTLKRIKGVEKAKANASTQIAEIEYDGSIVNIATLISAIENAGYSAQKATVDNEHARTQQINSLKKKFLISFVLSMPLFYLVMAPLIGLPSLQVAHKTMAIIQFILATPVMIVSRHIFIRGAKAMFINRMPTADSLIGLGVGAAYIFSIAAMIVVFFNYEAGMESFYFETAAFLLTFILLGHWLEAIAKGKASEAIRKLMNLQPKIATVLRKGKEIKIPAEELKEGDIVIMKPGERIPTDGIIISGNSSVDESMITGESMPVEKSRNSKVIGGTVNKHGSFKFKATKVGSSTTLAQIIKLVEQAQESRAPIQDIADKIAAILVPAVLLIAVTAFIFWYAYGQGIIFALSSLIAVLIIACPCSIGLAAPTAVMVGTGKAAEKGVLIKSAGALQAASEIDTIVFDKTGTITKGAPVLTDVIPLTKITKDELLTVAGSVEKPSEHPLAEAIVKAAIRLKISPVTNFRAFPGKGVRAFIGKTSIVLGTRKLMEDEKISYEIAEKDLKKLEDEGKTAMLIAISGRLTGVLAVADTIKENSAAAVNELKNQGKKVIMITGDNERTAAAIAKEASIDEFFAQVMPEDKAKKIEQLQAQGRNIAMVGDGINDAPALAQAQLGIAIGSGTDIAIESADIVLVKNELTDVVTAIDISTRTVKKMKQNFFWAFFYNTIGIPIAAGVLYPFTGWLLNPAIAGAAMALSSVTVVGNSLLLKMWKSKIK